MRRSRLLLLVFNVADIEHITHDASRVACPQHLPLKAIPHRRLCAVSLMQPGAQQASLVMHQQLIETAGHFIAISRVKQPQPLLARQISALPRHHTGRQWRRQLELLKGWRPLPPAAAQ